MELTVGIKGKYTITVDETKLASAVGSGLIPVFSTPCMIAIMECAASTSVADAVGEGNVTVGTKLDISHLAATPCGMDVYAQSELVAIEGKKLVFKVEAYDETEKIGEGMHERFIVGAEKFLTKCNAKKK